MTDRELLELAAKAAGYGVHAVASREQDGTVSFYMEPDLLYWNPLIDDGDAFRLAANLGLVVDFSRPSAALPFTRHSYDLSDGGGSAEAARRAVVRAAAEIGRAMQ